MVARYTGPSAALTSGSMPVIVTSSSLDAKIPTLGQKTTSGSISVTLSSDHSPVPVYTPEYSWQSARALTTYTIADSEPPTTFVVLSGSTTCPFVEVKFESMGVSGTVSPSQVTFRTWNRVGGSIVTKIDEFTVDASYLSLPKATNPILPRVSSNNSDEVYVTYTFPDGTAPTLSGTISCRAVTKAELQRKDFTYNPATGHMIVETLGYDSVTDTVKTSPSYVESDLPLPEPLVADTTALTAGTEYYYPNSDGALMTGYDSIAFEYSLTAANAGTITTWWEATIGSSLWTQRNVITLSGGELTFGTQHASSSLASATNGTIAGITCFDNLNVERVRQVVKPVTGNSGAVKVSLRRKVRGS